jgi:hypothetical protein
MTSASDARELRASATASPSSGGAPPGRESHAVFFLQEQDMTRFDARRIGRIPTKASPAAKTPRGKEESPGAQSKGR